MQIECSTTCFGCEQVSRHLFASRPCCSWNKRRPNLGKRPIVGGGLPLRTYLAHTNALLILGLQGLHSCCQAQHDAMEHLEDAIRHLQSQQHTLPALHHLPDAIQHVNRQRQQRHLQGPHSSAPTQRQTCAESAKALKTALREGQGSAFELLCCGLQGQHFWNEVSIAPIATCGSDSWPSEPPAVCSTSASNGAGGAASRGQSRRNSLAEKPRLMLTLHKDITSHKAVVAEYRVRDLAMANLSEGITIAGQ